MRETQSAEVMQWKTNFLDVILKVQLAKETNKKEGLPRERTFIECAQDMIDASARKEDSRMEVEEGGWNRVTYTRPRNNPAPWRRKDQRNVGRERGSGDRRTNQAKPRNNGRREERRCHGCGKTGHLVAQCPRTRCFECGNEGHIAR
nr:uncharacterized protein LOC106691695 [Halyomorpha halys]